MDLEPFRHSDALEAADLREAHLKERLEHLLNLGSVAQKTWDEERAELKRQLEACQGALAQLRQSREQEHVGQLESLEIRFEACILECDFWKGEAEALRTRLRRVEALQEQWQTSGNVHLSSYVDDYYAGRKRQEAICAEKLRAALTGASTAAKEPQSKMPTDDEVLDFLCAYYAFPSRTAMAEMSDWQADLRDDRKLIQAWATLTGASTEGPS